MKGLTGKVAIVTAAAGGGIGKATAIRLAEEGAIVVVTDSHERRTPKPSRNWLRAFRGASTVTLDVSRRDEIDRTVGEVEARPAELIFWSTTPELTC